MNLNVQISARHLLDCIEDIYDIFLEEAETAVFSTAARNRKIRNGALAAAGAVGIAFAVWLVKSKRMKKSA
jgi:hypothetical protein